MARSRSPISSISPTSFAFGAQKISPVASSLTRLSSIPLAFATTETKSAYESSISDCIFCDSSGVGLRQKAPMSLRAPLLLTLTLTPSFSRSCWSTGRIEMTPMEPTMADGDATMRCAAHAIR